MSDSILFLGSTGFVGGQVLYQLLTSPPSNVKNIIIPVSTSSKKSKVEQWILQLQTKVETQLPVIEREPASNWYSQVKTLSSQVDCCIQLATSDDLQLTRAINQGLIQGKEEFGKKGVLIHASGVQLIESKTSGEYLETPNYNDLDPSSIASIPDSAAHRNIDLEIEETFQTNQLCGAIVCPALVWGKGAGPDKVVSVMIPDTVQKSLHNGKATYTGKGTNTWPAVHIEDCAELIVNLITKNLSSPHAKKNPAKFTNFYFASYNDKLINFKHIAEVMGKALLERGKLPTAETISVPVPAVDPNSKGVRIEDGARSQADVEVDARTPLWPCRTNVRCQANRGKEEFGWQAKKDFTDEAIRQDVFVALDNM